MAMLRVALEVLYIPIRRWLSSNISLLTERQQGFGTRAKKYLPKRNNDELCILGSILDVIGDDRNVAEIQGSIYLVHEIQWGWLHKNSQTRHDR